MFNIISQDKNENSKSQTLLYYIDTCVCIYIYIHTHTIYLLNEKDWLYQVLAGKQKGWHTDTLLEGL